MNILKGFDRAFWIRFKTFDQAQSALSPDEEQMRVQSAPADFSEMMCPFRDPELTGTMLVGKRAER